MQVRRKRILLVDDDRIVRECLEAALSGRYEVLVAADGQEGLVRAERDAPDLIVLDMMMPRRSGFMVLNRLRQRPGLGPRVVMVTANEDARHQAYAQSQGVDAYVRKPFDVGDFVALVDALLADVAAHAAV